jgi:hypothetical protein
MAVKVVALWVMAASIFKIDVISNLKMEAVYFSEMLVSTCQIILSCNQRSQSHFTIRGK